MFPTPDNSKILGLPIAPESFVAARRQSDCLNRLHSISHHFFGSYHNDRTDIFSRFKQEVKTLFYK